MDTQQWQVSQSVDVQWNNRHATVFGKVSDVIGVYHLHAPSI